MGFRKCMETLGVIAAQYEVCYGDPFDFSAFFVKPDKKKLWRFQRSESRSILRS